MVQTEHQLSRPKWAIARPRRSFLVERPRGLSKKSRWRYYCKARSISHVFLCVCFSWAVTNVTTVSKFYLPRTLTYFRTLTKHAVSDRCVEEVICTVSFVSVAYLVRHSRAGFPFRLVLRHLVVDWG